MATGGPSAAGAAETDPSAAHHAVLLAGGPGMRIPPYTTQFPKPLVPLGQQHAVIEVVLRQLARQGFGRVSIAIGYLGELVQAYCGDGSAFGVPIDYWVEQEPLGTVGPLLEHLDDLPEHVLVMNGDTLTDLDCRELLCRHVASGAPLTVATCRRSDRTDFGVLETGGDGRIVSFSEKPVRSLTVSTGVYAVRRDVLGRYRPGAVMGFDDLVLDLIAAGDHPVAETFDGLWLDLGRAEEYEAANADWDRLSARLLAAD
jgi:NDP-mannose synthase